MVVERDSHVGAVPAGDGPHQQVSPAAETVPGPRRVEPPARSLQPGQNLRDRYHIVRQIGRGAMGEVYEARHARLVGRYAIKILNVDLTQNHTALQRFRREAAIASELRHPSIVQVIDFDETDDGRRFLVMELMPPVVGRATDPAGGPATRVRRGIGWMALSAGVVVVGTKLALRWTATAPHHGAQAIPPSKRGGVIAPAGETRSGTADPPRSTPMLVATSDRKRTRARQTRASAHRRAEPAVPRPSTPVPEPALTSPPPAAPEPETASPPPEVARAGEKARDTAPAISRERKEKLIVPHL